jgi:hypothetical protein
MARAFDQTEEPPIVDADLAERLLIAASNRGAAISGGSDVYNIIYVEGLSPSGRKTGNRDNAFDDARFLVQIIGNTPRLAGAWEATTEPGKFWTQHRMDPRGAFHIDLGYQEVWRMGEYHDIPALVQVKPIRGYRDGNNSYKREGKLYVEDDLGVHHHGGYDYPVDDLGRSSAGCQVGRTIAGHARFMGLLSTDRRYKADHRFVFGSTVLPAEEI